jgi:hypothetical protein
MEKVSSNLVIAGLVSPAMGLYLSQRQCDAIGRFSAVEDCFGFRTILWVKHMYNKENE